MDRQLEVRLRAFILRRFSIMVYLACTALLFTGCDDAYRHLSNDDYAHYEPTKNTQAQWDAFRDSPNNRPVTEYLSLEDEFDYLAWRVKWLSDVYGINISADDLDFNEVRFFSWLDFVTPVQFAIAREHLHENANALNFFDVTYENFVFADRMIVSYVMNYMVYFPHAEFGDEIWFEMRRNPQSFNPHYILMHYDSISIEDMPYCPRRIIVRMYEASYVVLFEIRDKYAHLPYRPMQSNRVGSLGRDVFDWRE